MLWRPVTFIVVIIAALILSLVFTHSRYQTVKQNYQTLKQQYHEQIEALKLQKRKIDALHQLDIQHTKELNNAKAEIAKLHDAVRAGTKRLRVNAVCRASKTTTPKSRYDEASPQLGEAARQDYFHLREMIAENEKQTEYLQQYIKTQCSG
ncbi:lysis protein [Arsenophonus nasoniae]|uniref:Lysis protein n=1 Tax=Arsenophonus nasoniae TaxID=638 RepID=A0A4P7KUH7_9GAMM|nr:lysis protein [Arsenophonus nasoniae]QBY43506.1 Bacteriophage Rz lysis protein [Arsenophonus nasoniae]WGM07475.1 lysis protein [Arsenophonus nasoniae]WGM12331.1 lysis protein [Arsenophonus nasoniae]WGM17011.1 lysis protein [Arsenophonus nasoniae]